MGHLGSLYSACIYFCHQPSQQVTPWAQPSSTSYLDSALLLPGAALSSHPIAGCSSVGDRVGALGQAWQMIILTTKTLGSELMEPSLLEHFPRLYA